jgi:hypothetical protein
MFVRLAVEVNITVGHIQNTGDLGGMQGLDAEKVFLPKCHGAPVNAVWR